VHLPAQFLERQRLLQREERAHDVRPQPVRHFARARVAEAAGADGNPLVIRQLFDPPVIHRPAVPIIESHGDRAAPGRQVARAVNLHQRPAGVVPERGQRVDEPSREAHHALVDQVHPHGRQVAQSHLDGRDVEIVDRAVLKARFARRQEVAVTLHRRDRDRAAGIPGAPQPRQRRFARQQAPCAGRVAEHLVEREGHEVRQPARQVQPVGRCERRGIHQHVPAQGLRLPDQFERVLRAREVGLRGKREEIRCAPVDPLQLRVQPVHVDAQLRRDDGDVGEGGALVPRELPDAVHRVVVVEGEQVAAALRERVGLAHQLERVAGIGCEDRRVLARRRVEVLQHVLAGLFDQVSHRLRGRVVRVRVAEDVARQQRQVAAQLALRVQAAARVIQVDLAGFFQARVVARPQRVERTCGRVARTGAQKPRQGRLVHLARGFSVDHSDASFSRPSGSPGWVLNGLPQYHASNRSASPRPASRTPAREGCCCRW